MLATVCLLVFFHLRVASVALTCSGSFMLHSVDSRLSRSMVVFAVASAFPSLVSCHA